MSDNYELNKLDPLKSKEATSNKMPYCMWHLNENYSVTLYKCNAKLGKYYGMDRWQDIFNQSLLLLKFISAIVII